MQFTFTEALDYLKSLGERRLAIGRAVLGYEGAKQYPVLVVEPDPLAAESSPGLLNYDFAVLVLDRESVDGQYRKDPEQWPAVLARTGQWADELLEMLRHEYPGDLKPGAYSRVALTEFGADLAIGWRVELRLQVQQNINRNTNAALFAVPVPPEPPQPVAPPAPAGLAIDADRVATFTPAAGTAYTDYEFEFIPA